MTENSLVALEPAQVKKALQDIDEHVRHAHELADRIKQEADDLTLGPWRSHNATLFGRKIEEKYDDIRQVVQRLDTIKEQAHSAGDQIAAQAGSGT
ncbi:WXG100 family type VII secretion target [Mycobacterium talmoniae]|uniref:Uncharacterized protein n=1 Tax=Mycobacterium talmoniae TaxID=1858794 RepID=A0A2S8BDY5_9MYCO|nr:MULTISPECIES: WXG100 family type VII secretion target [Mycobacterium]PQM44846.1 hypothetical protein C1Y40_04996 [Mycobacterium talmoniae]TDH46453.1 hypothetical protein E2F47_27205 [Mycobacterium eburneum]